MSETLTIRVSRSTHALLQELASRSDRTMAQVVDEAVRDLREKEFWAGYHASYTALRGEQAAWADLQRDAAAWDTTLADGLEETSDEPQRKPRRRSGAR